MDGRLNIAALADDLDRRDHGVRFLLGICGAPGAGKSTIAEQLAVHLGGAAVVVPMDGFHLASSVINDTELASRRGAPDTFDVDGFIAMLRRLRTQREAVVYVPCYDRTIENPIAGAISVPVATRIVIVEGNYLLHTQPPWNSVPEHLDETWYVEHADDRIRIERLVARHVRFGRTADESNRWVQESDEHNARLIAAGRSNADLIITEHRDGTMHVSRP